MKKVMGIINLANEPNILGDLIKERSLAATPYGGRYRLIDFTLSNMVNSGIHNVGIFTMRKYRSLMDHLGSGKEWDLDRQRKGLFILPPTGMSSQSQGDLQLFREHSSYLQRSQEEYVLVTPGHLIWNVDFCDVYEQHLQTEADVTLIYYRFSSEPSGKRVYWRLDLDEMNRVQQMTKTINPEEDEFVYSGAYLIKRELLMKYVESAELEQNYDLLRDVVIPHLSKLNISAWEFQGYFPEIHSIESYFDSSMGLLDPNNSQQLFYNNRPIYTKVKHEPPAKYSDTSRVENSIVANGCMIEGTVENSILSRGVKIHKNAVVRNAIILQKTEIHEGAFVEHAILDKEVKVMKGESIKGDQTPVVIPKGQIVDSVKNP